MTTGYKIPPQLDEEIGQLEALIAKFRAGAIAPIELKVHRVPFGVYEQREADTYMVRIRCVAGIVTPGQLEKVAAIAARYGVGDLHLTSRQELQIHYVKLDDLVAVIRQLKEAGLSTRGGGGNTVRNIAAQDDAGIDPLEVFDVTPYAAALTTRLIAENDSWNLPRKYKIAFSGSEHDKGQATLADLGFIARIVDGKKGFRVHVAGGLGVRSAVGNLLFDFVDDTQVYPIAKAVKDLFWNETECVVQYHPPKADYVNNHPHCLHLWGRADGNIPRPPAILVGVKDRGVLTPSEARQIKREMDGA